MCDCNPWDKTSIESRVTPIIEEISEREGSLARMKNPLPSLPRLLPLRPVADPSRSAHWVRGGFSLPQGQDGAVTLSHTALGGPSSCTPPSQPRGSVQHTRIGGRHVKRPHGRFRESTKRAKAAAGQGASRPRPQSKLRQRQGRGPAGPDQHPRSLGRPTRAPKRPADQPYASRTGHINLPSSCPWSV